MKNEMTLAFDSISENEEFARVTVAAFASQLNPTLEEVADIRTAVSEAVTNAIIHGYPEGIHTIVLRVRMENQQLEVWVIDEGVGIADISRAMEPLYTSRPDLERSGMGFMFMEAFMDEVKVDSSPVMGTTVYMKKQIMSR
mgnify:CR=1 FL=1